MWAWNWPEALDAGQEGYGEEGHGTAYQVEESGDEGNCGGFLCGMANVKPEETEVQEETPCGCST